MSSTSRGRTTGPKYKHIKTTADLTDWLNRAVSRGGRGTSHTAQKERKRDIYLWYGFGGRASRRKARGK